MGYRATNKDHNNVFVMDTDDESESFLVDDFEDIPSADDNIIGDLPKDNWPKSRKTASSQIQNKAVPNADDEVDESESSLPDDFENISNADGVHQDLPNEDWLKSRKIAMSQNKVIPKTKTIKHIEPDPRIYEQRMLRKKIMEKKEKKLWRKIKKINTKNQSL